MSVTGDRLAHAEARSEAARTRLRNNVDEIRARLRPARLLSDVVTRLKDGGEDAAQKERRHRETPTGHCRGRRGHDCADRRAPLDHRALEARQAKTSCNRQDAGEF